MAEMETFGSGIPDYVATQIRGRESIFRQESKSRQQIQLLNSNTGWAKLRSSVNKITEAEAVELLKNGDRSNKFGDSTIAQNNVLLGGTLATNNNARAGLRRSGTDINSTAAYQNYDSIGFRPMPGLISISVNHKGTFGSLMQADVKFTAWSKEQLDELELLYFRPGYTALLEWGHSVYLLDNQIEFASSGITLDNSFFDKSTPQSIDEEIEKRRRKYQGNYQGLFGFITNFQWSYRPDGGYDCEVKIVSRGIVLESITNSDPTSDLSPDEIRKKEAEEQKEKESTKQRYKSTLHAIFYTLSEYKSEVNTIDGIQALKEEGYESYANKISTYNKIQQHTFGEPNTFNVINYRVRVQEEGKTGVGSWFAGKDNLAYISLRSFLAILNAFEMLKDPTAPEESKVLAPFSLGYGNTYTTYKGHFSLNPLIAILPQDIKDLNVGAPNNSANKLAAGFAGNRTDDILNIYVSSNYLESEMNKIVDGVVEEGVGVYDFIKNVLAGIQQALGNINNFDIHFNETYCQFQIVDRGRPSATSRRQLENSLINVTGLGNTVVDLQIQSKISKEMSSQISIAAQGNTGNYNENLLNILQFNRGAIDRHIIAKDQSSNNDSQRAQEEAAKLEEKLKLVKKAYEKLRPADTIVGKVVNFFKVIDISDLIDLSTTASNLIGRDLSKDRVSKGIPDPLPIPITISIKMLGISGFKIGTAFLINDLPLPSVYKNYAYIIRAVSNEIGTDNKWYTTVEAYMYKIS
jgi:hypothetical protein